MVNQQKFAVNCQGEKWRLLEVPFLVSPNSKGGKEVEKEGESLVTVEVIWWAKVNAGQVASVDEFYLVSQ